MLSQNLPSNRLFTLVDNRRRHQKGVGDIIGRHKKCTVWTAKVTILNRVWFLTPPCDSSAEYNTQACVNQFNCNASYINGWSWPECSTLGLRRQKISVTKLYRWFTFTVLTNRTQWIQRNFISSVACLSGRQATTVYLVVSWQQAQTANSRITNDIQKKSALKLEQKSRSEPKCSTNSSKQISQYLLVRYLHKCIHTATAVGMLVDDSDI